MKLNLRNKYLIIIAAIALPIFIILFGSKALLSVPTFISYILCDRITQKQYGKIISFWLSEIVFSAVYSVYSCFSIVGKIDIWFIAAAFLLIASWGTLLKRSIYSDDNKKRRFSFYAAHQRNYIIALMFLVNDELIADLFPVLLFVSFLFFLYDLFETRHEIKQQGASKEISKELIVYADIRDFSYMPGLLRKASLRSYPILKNKLKNKSEDKNLVVINYEKYRCSNSAYDNALKKSLIIYCDNFEPFAKGSEAVLCGIAHNYISRNFEVFFVVDNVKKAYTAEMYRSLVHKIGNEAVFIDGADISADMKLEKFLSEKKALYKISVPEAEKLHDDEKAEPAKKESSTSSEAAYDNIYIPAAGETDTKKKKKSAPSFKKRPKPKDPLSKIESSYQTWWIFFAALFRVPLTDVLTDLVLTHLGKKRDSWLYGAIKKYFSFYHLLICGTLMFVHLFSSLYLFFWYVLKCESEGRLIEFFGLNIFELSYFVINPVEYIAAVALYFFCAGSESKKYIGPDVNCKKLIINMDISDMMKIYYWAAPSYYTEVNGLRSGGTEYIKLQNDIISVDYSYYRAHETLLSQITDKSVIIHARNDYEYYASFKEFDLRKEAEALTAQKMRIFIHTDYPETYPDLKNCVFIGGGYFECIKSVMMSSDHAAADTIDTAQRYCSLLFSAAQNRLDLFSAEHKTLYYQIEQLKQHYSMLEIFYEYMQTAELFMHYASLCVTASSEGSAADFSELSLGKMTEIISKEKRFFSSSIYGISSEDKQKDKQIKTELQRSEDFFTNNIGIKITTKRPLFRYAFDLIVQIRNRYLGHGSLVYYVSDEMICAFIPLASAVIAECIEIISSQGEAGKLYVAVLPGTNKPPIVRYMNGLYLYSKRTEKGTEYIDPITGSFYRTYTTETISLKWNKNARESV